MKGSIGPGEDIEAWCTRCRMNLNHRVIAVVGPEVQRVHCLTCGGDHKYHPPKYEKTKESEKRSVRVPSAEKSRKSTADKVSNKAAGEWNTFMKDMSTEASPRGYNASETYTSGEFIEHPLFGVGKVIDIVAAEKMQVVFREGRKILLCNRNQR
jgi:hypothetical protein